MGFTRFSYEDLHGFLEPARGGLPIEKGEMFLYSCIHTHILTPKLSYKHP